MKSLILLLCSLLPIFCYDLTNITHAVFGSTKKNVEFIPAAFGDFNSDRLTDLIVLTDNRKTVEVRLATEQKVVSSGNDPPIFKTATDNDNLDCNCPDGKFTSATPADFDGDGGMDLMLMGKKGETKTLYIYWGEQRPGQPSKLNCTARLDIANMISEPLVFDVDGDYIADLVTVDIHGNRTVYKFSHDRTFSIQLLDSQSAQSSQLKAEHSNAFIDINGDGAADLLLTTQEGLEMYENTRHNFTFHSIVSWPKLVGCTVDECIGQAVFTDFDLDGSLDMLLPVCFDPVCGNSTLYLIPLERSNSIQNSLWDSNGTWSWIPMSLDLGPYRFLPRDTSKSLLRLIAPRVGDVDLDGFPDLLMTLYNVSSGSTSGGQTQLLLNAPCGPSKNTFSECYPFWRQFQVTPSYMEGTGDSITSAFFDLYEDGRLDLLVVHDHGEDSHLVSAFTNTTQDSDAYFMKVIVLTGACYHNCPNKDGKYVPYGTNTGGQILSYRSQRPGPETFDSYQSVAAQLSQTSYFALQLPYTIFGLGLAPNFVDYLMVNQSQGSHEWPQIIPNSQLYVIPYGDPENWDAKLIIFTSKNIVITGLAMIGTCALVSFIIVALHIRERRMDLQAKLQEANRFHFDAM